jgi:hypothetical protein
LHDPVCFNDNCNYYLNCYSLVFCIFISALACYRFLLWASTLIKEFTLVIIFLNACTAFLNESMFVDENWIHLCKAEQVVYTVSNSQG